MLIHSFAVMTAKLWMAQVAKYGEKMPDKEEIVLVYTYKNDVYYHFIGKICTRVSCQWNEIVTFAWFFITRALFILSYYVCAADCTNAAKHRRENPLEKLVVEFAPISQSAFFEMWREDFSYVKIRKWLRFAKCDLCDGKWKRIHLIGLSLLNSPPAPVVRFPNIVPYFPTVLN